MRSGTVPVFEDLPASVRASLVDCISEVDFDEARFDPLVNEHHVGLSKRDRNLLIDATYLQYARQHPRPEGN